MDSDLIELAERVLTARDVGANPGFHPEQIVLAKGALDTPARQAFADKVCRTFPKAAVREQLDCNHMAAQFAPRGLPLAEKIALGKRTLVLGVIGQGVKRSTEANIHCPNYWHFSTTAFCWYDCAYCYLAGSCSSLVAPTVKIYVNLEDVLGKLRRLGPRIEPRPTSCYLGKLQDGLSLDWLTGYSRALVPFFAGERWLRWVLLTKSACVENLLDLEHAGHTAVSWSVNPASVCERFEHGAPALSERLDAARRCAEAGYPVRFIIMPLIPVDDWRAEYAELVEQIFDALRPARITLGGMCSFPTAARLASARPGGMAGVLDRCLPAADGRQRYAVEQRAEMYGWIMQAIRRRDAHVPLGLCLEDRAVFERVGLNARRVTCNCIWDDAEMA